jgi:hypothetical protein
MAAGRLRAARASRGGAASCFRRTAMLARKIALAVLLVTPLGAAIVSTWLAIDHQRAKSARQPAAELAPGIVAGRKPARRA